MFRVIILISLLIAGLTIGGCASTGSSSYTKSSQPPNFKNTKTGEKFYSGDNKKFMATHSECVKKSQRVPGIQSRQKLENYVEICLTRAGYERLHYRELRKPNTLGY